MEERKRKIEERKRERKNKLTGRKLNAGSISRKKMKREREEE